jgi:hypothetical protein
MQPSKKFHQFECPVATLNQGGKGIRARANRFATFRPLR